MHELLDPDTLVVRLSEALERTDAPTGPVLFIGENESTGKGLGGSAGRA